MRMAEHQRPLLLVLYTARRSDEKDRMPDGTLGIGLDQKDPNGIIPHPSGKPVRSTRAQANLGGLAPPRRRGGRQTTKLVQMDSPQTTSMLRQLPLTQKQIIQLQYHIHVEGIPFWPISANSFPSHFLTFDQFRLVAL